MRRQRLAIIIGCCVLIAHPFFASSGNVDKSKEFYALIAWAEQSGVPQKVGDGIPESFGAGTTKLPVFACSFNEVQANAKHVFCVSESPNKRKFLFFILMDVGDGTSIIWRVSSRGKLISTSCIAAGAVQAVPNTIFEAGFLAEKEYFLRTMRLAQHRTTPSGDASTR